MKVSFRIVERDKTATCEECKLKISASPDGRYQVTPHLRESHGFGAAAITFEEVAHVICPPMTVVEARQ